MSISALKPAEATPPAEVDDSLEYRSVHSFAVVGLLVGVISAVALFTAGRSLEATLLMAPIPIAGLIVSVLALRSIAAAPETYTGRPLAMVGAALSAFFLVSSVGYSSYVYATEVPDGYERLSFVEMKPSERDQAAGRLAPAEVDELIDDGDPVFIKGYIRPDSSSVKKNMRSFLLVRDSNECCFGDLSKVKYFDQIQVDLVGKTTDFHGGLFRVGGKLSRGPGEPTLGTPITYHLKADYVEP
ncbi:hypothetical protein [Botrimarina sp.]|uniref:hypothetical protein n=1 Tax=Botrimarina sp. TaxID=2795802 RepID=UPI0032EEBCBE